MSICWVVLAMGVSWSGVGAGGLTPEAQQLADGSAATSRDLAAARQRPYQAFGGLGRIGPVGRGTVFVTLEAAYDSEAGWRSIQYRDRWIEASNDLRPGARREIDRSSEEQIRRIRWRDASRTVTIEVDGNQVTHEHQGPIGARKSQRIPKTMERPLVLASDRVTDYQRFFDVLLADTAGGIPGLDGQTIAAIDPAKLAVYDFVIAVEGAEPLELPTGSKRFARVQVTRIEPSIGTLPRNASLDERRVFWLSGTGEIMRMEVPHQPRHQGTEVVLNLAYWPDYYGAATRTVNLGTVAFPIASRHLPGLDRSVGVQRGAALMIVHDGSPESRALIPSTLWGATRQGVTVGTIDLDPESEASLERAGAAIAALRADPTVDPERVSLLTLGQALPKARVWDLGSLNGWILVNGHGAPSEALRNTLEPSHLPVQIVWGDDGEGFHARRQFAEAVREIDPARIHGVPIASADVRMGYVAGIPDSTPRDDFGRAFGYLRTLQRWFDKRQRDQPRPKTPR